MIPVDPDIDDAGPTKEHRGSAAFWHIESKVPNTMTAVPFVEEIQVRINGRQLRLGIVECVETVVDQCGDGTAAFVVRRALQKETNRPCDRV